MADEEDVVLTSAIVLRQLGLLYCCCIRKTSSKTSIALGASVLGRSINFKVLAFVQSVYTGVEVWIARLLYINCY